MIDWKQLDKDAADAAAKHAGYRAPDYTGRPCKNCGRNRVMNCVNGKHVCEKCGWDADAHHYDPHYSPA